MLYLKLKAMEDPGQILARSLGMDHVELPYPAAGYLEDLDERTLVERVGTYMGHVACISLEVEGRGVSYWMNMGSEAKIDGWMQVQLSGAAARGGLDRVFSRAISIMSSS